MLDVVFGNQSPSRSAPGLDDRGLGAPTTSSATPANMRASASAGRAFTCETDVQNDDPSLVIFSAADFEGLPESENIKREQEFRRSRSNFFLFIIAVVNLAVVHSELVCYLILVVNHMRSANVLSLVYPLMVFLWGMLSVPRPSKTFWITLITYTEVGFLSWFLEKSLRLPPFGGLTHILKLQFCILSYNFD